MSIAPLRNITAEIDHNYNNNANNNTAAAQQLLRSNKLNTMNCAPTTAAIAPVYAPTTVVYAPTTTASAGTVAQQMTRSSALNPAAAAFTNVISTTSTTSAYTSVNQSSAAIGTNGGLQPLSAASLLANGGLVVGGTKVGAGATSASTTAGAAPARRVTLLRSNPTTVAAVAAATAQQQQQQQQQHNTFYTASSVYQPSAAGLSHYTASSYHGHDHGVSAAAADTTRPQTPTPHFEASHHHQQGEHLYGGDAAAMGQNVPSTPTPATSAFVSPAKPRATLYRPVARNFFVTPVKESTAAGGDNYLNNNYRDPHGAVTPNGTPAGKGRRPNNNNNSNANVNAGGRPNLFSHMNEKAAIVLEREAFGTGNTPKANEKKAKHSTANNTTTSAAATSATVPTKGGANANRKLMIGDDDETTIATTLAATTTTTAANPTAVVYDASNGNNNRRQQFHPYAQPSNGNAHFTHQQQNQQQMYGNHHQLHHSASSPMTNNHHSHHQSNSSPYIANAGAMSTPVRSSKPSHTPMKSGPGGYTPLSSAMRSSGQSASSPASNYLFVEMEGLLGQRMFAVTKSADLAVAGTHVVFEGDRGDDMGRIVNVSTTAPTVGQMKASGGAGSSPLAGAAQKNTADSGNSPTNDLSPNSAAAVPVIPNAVVLRKASDEEINYWRVDLVAEAEAAINKCTECICRHGLNLIIVNAVFQFDHKKLTFFYETELPRVDFRKILAELYNEFHCRIWMERVE